MENTLNEPEILYFGMRGHSVFKKISPDGETKALSHWGSLKFVNHSPTGFSWGYGGSGPAQLAFALLLDATSDPEQAQSFYQDFKWDHVAKWDFHGRWDIYKSEILKWLEMKAGQRAIGRISRN